jgi:hypothetical protein
MRGIKERFLSEFTLSLAEGFDMTNTLFVSLRDNSSFVAFVSFVVKFLAGAHHAF